MAFKKPKKVTSDAYLGTNSIVGLKEDTFSNFLAEKEMVLVMFYHPKNTYSQFSKTHFLKATKTSKKSNALFAAVNCEEEKRLCLAENVKDIPNFKIYSHGRLVVDKGLMTDYRKMMQALEEAPVLAPKPVSKTQFQF